MVVNKKLLEILGTLLRDSAIRVVRFVVIFFYLGPLRLNLAGGGKTGAMKIEEG